MSNTTVVHRLDVVDPEPANDTRVDTRRVTALPTTPLVARALAGKLHRPLVPSWRDVWSRYQADVGAYEGEILRAMDRLPAPSDLPQVTPRQLASMTDDERLDLDEQLRPVRAAMLRIALSLDVLRRIARLGAEGVVRHEQLTGRHLLHVRDDNGDEIYDGERRAEKIAHNTYWSTLDDPRFAAYERLRRWLYRRTDAGIRAVAYYEHGEGVSLREDGTPRRRRDRDELNRRRREARRAKSRDERAEELARERARIAAYRAAKKQTPTPEEI